MKDTAAACVAELVAGRGRGVHSFLYVFVDTFIGGGLVIDSHLRSGSAATRARSARCRSACAPARGAAPRRSCSASPRCTRWSGPGPRPAWPGRRRRDAPRAAAALARRRRRPGCDAAALAIAHAISSAACLLDLEAVIIDGAIEPRPARRPARRGRRRAEALQLGGRARARAAARHHRRRRRARSAARCCRCTPTSRRIGTCSSSWTRGRPDSRYAPVRTREAGIEGRPHLQRLRDQPHLVVEVRRALLVGDHLARRSAPTAAGAARTAASRPRAECR